MTTQIECGLTVKFKKNDVVCALGENIFDLYIVTSGKLLVMVNKGSEMIPLAYIAEGEYLGELSFFDKLPRSAHVICLEDTDLMRVPVIEIERQMPRWLTTVAKSITSRIREVDQLIATKGIRKKNAQSISALSIEEQTFFYKALEKYCEDKKLPSLRKGRATEISS